MANMLNKIFNLIVILLTISLLINSCKTTKAPTKTYISQSRQDYIEKYKDWAIREMKKTGIPASITLGQGILESGDGNSNLARNANNHFGIKCHSDWTGKRFKHNDDRRNECFRKYNSAEESYRDHSDFLTGKQRYASLFELNPTDYKGWAKGLKKAGYATHPKYDNLLIGIIETNKLYQYDQPGKYRPTAAKDNNEPISTSSSNQQIFTEEFNIPTGERQIKTMNRIIYILAREGDTFAYLAKEMDMMKWELPKYNEMTEDAVIIEGQIIFLQPKRNQAESGYDFHIVKEADSIWSISQKYGVKKERLYKHNGMKEGEEPEVGQKIWLKSQR